jgi:3-phytase
MSVSDYTDGIPVVSADVETFSKYTQTGVDAIDDPAIWVNPDNPGLSIILGTDKNAGLSTYRLNGREQQFVAEGKPNNVDVRYGFRTGDGFSSDLIGYTDMEKNEIVIMRVGTNGAINPIAGGNIRSDLESVHGFCFYQSQFSGKLYAIANDKEGNIEQWELRSAGTFIAVEKARTLKLKSQVEGMVSDDELGLLYVSEKNKGIWRFNAEPDGSPAGMFIKDSGKSNSKIAFDIEGLAIYKTERGGGYLIASSQGNNSFAVFSRGGNNGHIGSFRIGGGEFDDTRDADGIAVVSDSLSPQFPKGILVVQDGINYENDQLGPQNFKIVDFRKILQILQ